MTRKLIEQMLSALENSGYDDSIRDYGMQSAAITAALAYLAQPEQSEPPYGSKRAALQAEVSKLEASYMNGYECAKQEARDAYHELRTENDQIRTLMNIYNLGGWTDSLALIKERDALRAENERLKEGFHTRATVQMQKERDALRKELEAARKDAARMDFIEANAANKTLGWHRKNKWAYHATFTNYEFDRYQTARAAIDAAMEATK